MSEALRSLTNFIASLFSSSLVDEETEELRMVMFILEFNENEIVDLIQFRTQLTGFETSEIHRLKAVFLALTADPNKAVMTKEEFLEIDCIARNPLSSRIVACFDVKDGDVMDFKKFLVGLSYFNR